MNKHLVYACLILVAGTTAWGDPSDLKSPAPPTTPPAAANPAAEATPGVKLAAPGKAQSNVIELDPIGGNLNKGLPKYGPGWRLDPLINLPGMGLGSGVQNGSATGPR